ncbi:hypothetical protein [Anoxybacillus flavithermus]|uniref:hypothetical protein n=1 Tax=Anoxybacillus flavithermus TaxID=33934 RepID=UPI00186632BD|nr:hypothetical protein [Anoxybacillus flavithermus]MBE2939178.1 hypothetical protein [Anoxybacillus flavithermus]MBE2941851.1 hypothetical protein [Anoxybacillus flavithermus]MBE2950088.1 hypothetical protein [Anoxybacillus flavithermus]MBE2952702.1 hypothetical protein [Anoxybacillus flavithermus]MBE2958060.1 hypothetical protein [Anoxybacillus flavithermus]
MNEKGYSLVLVMLTVTVFFVIGLTIVSVSIYQAKFTQVRVEDVASLHEAVKSVEETVAELKAKVETLPLSTPTQLDLDLGNAQTGFLSELMKRHSVTIEDITDAKGIARNRNKLFTRVFRISAPYGKKTVSREVIITNAPSFLKYALGSRENVTLNGGAYIDGDIYAGKDIYVTNVANYIYNSTLYSVQTTFPTTSEKSILFVEGNRYACDHENGARSCYNLNNNKFEYSLLNYSEHELPPSLLIQKETEDFIDVDFSWTLKDKLLLAAGVEPFSYEYANYIKNSGDPEHLFNQLKENKAFSLVDDVMLLKDFIKNNQNSKSIVLQSAPSYVFENEDENEDENEKLDLKDKWLIVDGDLYLGNNSKLKGNIIVFGDLIINGKSGVQLASTIYVTGKTSIYDTNISGLDNEQVVILSKGRLELYRVNEFNNSFSFEKENLQGYFYTESNAVIYAVGSYINIKGGLFAKGNSEQTIADGFSEGVTINAYRGVVKSLLEPPNSNPTLTNVSESRFIIRHDKNVLIARGLGLPFSKRLHVIIDELSVK